MNLHSKRFYRACIKSFVSINQCNRYNWTSGFCCSLKASAFKLLRMISVFAPGSLCKDQIVSAIFDLFCYIKDNLHRLANILSVHHICFHAGKYLFQERHVSHFLFCHHRKRNRARIQNRQNIIQPLVIRIKYKTVFIWNILYTI